MTQIVQLLDEVMNECNFRAKSNYANAVSQDERQVFRLANRAVSSLMSFPWAKLRRFGEITLTSNTTYSLPADFHGLVPDTVRANSRVLPVEVNTNPGTWAWLKTRSSNAGIEYRTRWFRDTVEFFTPNAGDVVSYEYWSSHPITGADAITKDKFTADSDTWDLDDDLLTWEIIWRFKKSKGLADWEMDRAESLRYQDEYRGRQHPPRTVDVARPEPMLAGEPYTDQWID